MDFGYTPEQEAFRKSVRDWVEDCWPKSRALAMDNAGSGYPHELYDDLAAAGFHAVGLSEAHSGAGGDVVDQCILARELARSLAGMATLYTINSFAGGKSVGLYGTEEQKRDFIPKLAGGQLKFAIAVTEPSGGTDLLGAGDDLVLGEPDQAWYQLLATLNNERIITAAISLGILDGVIEEALRHAGERELFGQPLGQLQAVQHKIADMAIARRSAALVVHNAAWLQSRGEPCGLETTPSRRCSAFPAASERL